MTNAFVLGRSSSAIAQMNVSAKAEDVTWDRAVFSELKRDIGPKLAADSVVVFANVLATRLDVIRDVAVDFQRCRQEAHDLASMSGFLGFEALFQACLDFLARDRPSVDAMDRLTVAMENALDAAQTHLASLRNPS